MISLLSVDDRASGHISRLVLGNLETTAPASTRPVAGLSFEPGDSVGPYEILEPLGEGGFAIVYLAQQVEPIHRRIALKIIKPGMDTKEVLARFEIERQALALMDHPHIAKIYDAGATSHGRPYFAMEYVNGTPITEYCDAHRQTIEERLVRCSLCSATPSNTPIRRRSSIAT